MRLSLQGGRRERSTLDFKCNVSSSPIICFSIIIRIAFADVFFCVAVHVHCTSELFKVIIITSGFTDHSSPNCLQKDRESRLQYVYSISSHTIKESHWNAAWYFGMLCTFFSGLVLFFPINALVASSPVNAYKPSSILQ